MSKSKQFFLTTFFKTFQFKFCRPLFSHCKKPDTFFKKTGLPGNKLKFQPRVPDRRWWRMKKKLTGNRFRQNTKMVCMNLKKQKEMAEFPSSIESQRIYRENIFYSCAPHVASTKTFPVKVVCRNLFYFLLCGCESQVNLNRANQKKHPKEKTHHKNNDNDDWNYVNYEMEIFSENRKNIEFRKDFPRYFFIETNIQILGILSLDWNKNFTLSLYGDDNHQQWKYLFGRKNFEIL